MPKRKKLWYPFLNPELLRIKEEVAYRKIVVGYNNITKLRGLWKFLSRVRCKWENEVGNQGGRAEDRGVSLLQVTVF
jgi:hypothetical protein